MDEQEIREAAYRLWEQQGKPQGQDLEHWFTAEKSAGDEDLVESAPESTGGGEAPQFDEDIQTDSRTP